ncbi:MAG TPA: GTP-binding protein [Kofleriaceae bacterium]|nr:GTP-binding protein [Kofleriaceae bacterium]
MVPLILLTGFLGSGKTTLVNRLLARRAARGDTGGKLGIIVNELGEVDIDGALLAAGPGGTARQINLPGGCVCCVLGDDLDRTLLELVDANPGLEAIVLETTGVAEPLPIAWAIAREPVNARVRLAAVVTLVDATNFRRSRGVTGAVDAQVAYADVLLVTKAELAAADEVRAVESEIRTLASRALVRLGSTDDHADWLEAALADPPLDRPDRPDPSGHVHDEHCRHLDNHAHGIDSVWVPATAVVDLEELEDQLGDLPSNYVRIKGIVRGVDGRVGQTEPRWYVVHRVGLRVSSEPVDALAPTDAQQGRMVGLGVAVDRGPLTACLEAAAI